MKTLIILSAVPASGKSTWAKEFLAKNPNAFVISSDAIRLELTHGDPTDRSKQAEVWKVFEQRIHECAKKDENAIVVLDALNDLNVLRKKYVVENPEFDKYVLVHFPVNREKSRYYNGLRDEMSKVPEDVLEMLMDKFEEPNDEVKELFDEIIEVKWEE